MNEPKFWVGDMLCWEYNRQDKGTVIVVGGPFKVEFIREPTATWDGHPVYLCRLSDGSSMLLGENVLRSRWVCCPGEHRRASCGGWERNNG